MNKDKLETICYVILPCTFLVITVILFNLYF